MSEVTEQQLEDMEALFVQTAASMTSDRGTITLHGVSPSTLYFADRPQREVGHMSSCHFVAHWAAGTTASRTTPRTPSCRSRSRATGWVVTEDAVRGVHLHHLTQDPRAAGPPA